MAAYLVTHSLLSSWLHLIRENPYEDLTTEGDPLAEFMLVLRREPTPRTEAMQNGIDFENLVTAIVNGHDDPNNLWNWAAGQIAANIKGGQLQFKARRTIQVRGIRPIKGVGEQMSMLETASEDSYISPDAYLLFTMKDGVLVYRMSKTFTIEDTKQRH